MYKFYKGAYGIFPPKNKRERHMQIVEFQKRWKEEYTRDNMFKWHRNWRKSEWSRKNSRAVIYQFEIADVDI